MKKLLGILTLVLAFTLVPTQVFAAERIAVILTNNNMYLKEGPVNASWSQVTLGATIEQMGLVGDWVIALVGGYDDVTIKEPLINSHWNIVYGGTGGDANKFAASRLSNGNYRLLVKDTSGNVHIKDGTKNSGWWSGPLQTDGSVHKIYAHGDRIGLLMSNGDLKVKQLTPGQFTHPNNTSWQLVADNVTEAAITDTRIAILRFGAVYAKEGDISAPWFNNQSIIISYATNVRLGGNRICGIKDPNWSGTNKYVECREGSLGSNPKPVYHGAIDFKVNATRFLGLKANGNADVLEGTLSHNSGWRPIATSVDEIELN